MPTWPLTPDEEGALDDAVDVFAQWWTRRLLAVPDDSTVLDGPLPPETSQMVRLAALAAHDHIRAALARRLTAAAHDAAAGGVTYGDIGAVLGMTRQGARKRFPGLDDMKDAPTGGAGTDPCGERHTTVTNPAGHDPPPAPPLAADTHADAGYLPSTMRIRMPR